MEIRSSTSSERFQNLHGLEYINNTKHFQHLTYRKPQRLIPLTREIEKAMVNFNGSESDTSVSERVVFNTMSLMSLVADEVYNILQNLPISNQTINREEIGDIIKKSLQDCDTNMQHVILHDADNELEITVKDVTEDQDKTMLFAKKVQNIENRITKLERRLSFLVKNFPKLSFLQAKQFNFNTDAIKGKLNSLSRTNSIMKKESLKDEHERNKNKEISHNVYDDLFYATREYTLNLLSYKKSLASLELNKHPEWNPYVKPTHHVLCAQAENVKKLSMFLTS